jgi:hypothetical protein
MFGKEAHGENSSMQSNLDLRSCHILFSIFLNLIHIFFFTARLNRLDEVGIVHRYNRLYSQSNLLICESSKGGFQEHLSLHQVAGAFIILCFSVIIVASIFCVEILLKPIIAKFKVFNYCRNLSKNVRSC